MGDLEGWTGILADEECPTSANPLPSAIDIDIERWTKAELRTAELISRIQPTVISEYRRNAVVQYVQSLIRQRIGCEVFTFGSVPLKTYLPDGDIDLSAFSKNQNVKNTWANEVRSALEEEERNKDAEFRVKEVQYIHAEVKLVKCLIENIVVDISFNQLGGLCTLCFLEQVNLLIGKNHLFKRSIILVKAWCYYESRILGAHHGLISTYALETLVLYIFHLFHGSLRGPLEVLYRFLDCFSNFDWDNYCVSIRGPVPISSRPEIAAEPPQTDGGKVLLNKEFLRKCTEFYSVFPKGHDSQSRSFSPKYLNVVDPLRENNNLGRSVSKGNFYRIRSAFGYGARKLGKILQSPEENIAEELDNFFLNTWERHGSGQRPDVPDSVSCGLESKLSGESAILMALSKSIVENSKQGPKETVSSKETKAQLAECIGQSKNSISDSGKLQQLLISSSVESMSPITEANGADMKMNLFDEIKKVEALPVEIGSKVKGDLPRAPNYGKQLAGKEAGQHSESHAFSKFHPNESSRTLPGEGYLVSSGRLAGDVKDLASDNQGGPAISKRESSDTSSKQRSSTEGNNCGPSANHRGKSISGSVPTNSKLHISPPIAKKGLAVEANVNEEFAGRMACSEATISSHGNIPVESDGETCQFASNIKQESVGNGNSRKQENFDANKKTATSRTLKPSLSSSYVEAPLPSLQSSQMPSCLPVSVGTSLSGPVISTGQPSVLKSPLQNTGSALPDSCTSQGFVAHDAKFVVSRGPVSLPLPDCQLPLGLGNVCLPTINTAPFQSQLGVDNQQQQHNGHWPDLQNLSNGMNFHPVPVSIATVAPVIQPLSAGGVISASQISGHAHHTQPASAQVLNFSNPNTSETASESSRSSVEHGILEDSMKWDLVALSKHITCSTSKTREALEQGTYACDMSSISAGNVVTNENGDTVIPGLISFTEQEGFSEYPQNFPPSITVHTNLIPYIPQQNIGTPLLPARPSGPVLAGYSPAFQMTYRAPVAMMLPPAAVKQASPFPVDNSFHDDSSKSLKSPVTEISSFSLNATHLPRATESAASNPCVYHSAGSSLPSVEMYNSLYPIQPSLESGVVSFGYSGRTIENTKEVSRDESLKDQQTRKSTQTSPVHKENMEITTTAIACPRLESVPVGPMVDGLSSPRSDLLSGDFRSHLRNLAYGRSVLHGSMLPYTVLPPRYAHEQGLWEGPGRPFHSNMNMPTHIRGHGVVSGNPFLHASGYLGTNSRSGTGTYFPNLTSRSYRERFSANKDRHHQGTPSHDLTGREGSGAHQNNNRYNSVPHWQTGCTDIDANTAAGKFGGSDISRQEIAEKSSYHPSSPAVMGDTVLTPAGSMTLYPSGPPVVMLYPYSNGVTFPSGQLEFGSFGPLQFTAIPRVRSGQGGSIGSGALNDQSYTPGSVALSSISSEKGLQQPATPSKQEREAPQSYQLKEEDFPPLSFQGQHRGSATAAANDRGQSDRGSHCQAYVVASTL